MCIDSLRAAAAKLFPDAATKQAKGVLHVSLLRILSLPTGQYGPSAAAARVAHAVCERWSAQLRGARVSMRGLVYVREEQIITLRYLVVSPLPYQHPFASHHRLRSSRSGARGGGSRSEGGGSAGSARPYPQPLP